MAIVSRREIDLSDSRRDLTHRPPSKALNPRAAAALAVVEVAVAGRYLDNALVECFASARDLDGRDQALIQELAYGTLRWYHQVDGIARMFLSKPLASKDTDVHALLLGGLYQLRHMRVASHAAVSETVAAAAALGKPWAKGLINACLRAALRQSTHVDAAIASTDTMAHSHPEWLIEAVRSEYPGTWHDIFHANNQRPPLVLRVNLARTSRIRYLERLRATGITARPIAETESGVRLESPMPITGIPGFADGAVSIQDGAAQLAAMLLDAQPGERVLDACAAPGGKAAHILERCPNLAELVAFEPDAERRIKLEQTLKRLNLSARVLAADATAAVEATGPEVFDRILVDAPCSASGVIRRHPDIKLRRKPEDLARLVPTQAAILDGVWPCLKPGGKLLYVTCSILDQENSAQIEAFLTRQARTREADLALAFARRRRHGYQILPGTADMDGFYYACVEKP